MSEHLKNSPVVAVCIPTYRGSLIIKETLDSLLNQTHQNFKVYISDDTPPHEHEERNRLQTVIADYKDERFQYRANEKNL